MWPECQELTGTGTDILLHHLDLHAGERVLDVGSGGGTTILAAGELVVPAERIVTADISEGSYAWPGAGQPAFLGVPEEELAEARVAMALHLAGLARGDGGCDAALAFRIVTAHRPGPADGGSGQPPAR